MVKEVVNEMINWFVRDEMKVMGTDDQRAGEKKPEVDSRLEVMYRGNARYTSKHLFFSALMLRNFLCNSCHIRGGLRPPARHMMPIN